MEDLYSIHPGISGSGEIAAVGSTSGYPYFEADRSHSGGATEASDISGGGGSDLTDLIKAQIASHPRYPSLVSAYIECRKVGAPPEIASLLEEIGRKRYTSGGCGEIGADPELDEFMESYCRVLQRYKEELSKPFDEAASFLNSIEMQLSNLCKGCTTSSSTTTATGNSPSGKAIWLSKYWYHFFEKEKKSRPCSMMITRRSGGERERGVLWGLRAVKSCPCKWGAGVSERTPTLEWFAWSHVLFLCFCFLSLFTALRKPSLDVLFPWPGKRTVSFLLLKIFFLSFFFLFFFWGEGEVGGRMVVLLGMRWNVALHL